MDELIAQAEVGEEARKFLESDLYKVLVGIAGQQVEDALGHLKSADPNDPVLIRKLQHEIKLFDSFEAWLRELVIEGDNAISIYRQRSQ